MIYDGRNAIIVVLNDILFAVAGWIVHLKSVTETLNSEGAIIWQAPHEKLEGVLGGFHAALALHTSTAIDKEHEVEL